MRVAVIGSRGYRYLGRVEAYIKRLPPDTVVVTGDASGVDAAAREAARKHGMSLLVHAVDEGLRPSRGNGIYYGRNLRIVRDADLIMAFWDGKSPGTRMVLDIAERDGVPVEICSNLTRRACGAVEAP